METNRRHFMQAAGMAAASMNSVLLAGGNQAASVTASPTQGTAQASSMTELFLDNVLLEMTPGVSRRLHRAKKHLLNPVVRCQRWSDGNHIQPYTTMYDRQEKLFKMWARTGSDAKSGYVGGNAAFMTYLTSRDGIHWDKPNLGVLEVAGRRDHNIIYVSDQAATVPNTDPQAKLNYVVPTTKLTPQGKKAMFWSVARNPHPTSKNDQYVGFAIVQDHRRGAHIVTSPDGIHWTCANAPFWQTPHDVAGNGDDCLMHAMYDKAKRKWVLYRRIIPEFSERMIANETDQNRKPADHYYRSYAYAESDNLRDWKNHRFILAMDADDPADTELYQFSCHQYGSNYVGFMSVFYLNPQSIDIQLATSRDGIHFTRVCRGQPFIPSGPHGYYDYMAMCCSQPEPIIVDDTVYLYYATDNFSHAADFANTDPELMQSGVGLATFKRDRFVSLETGGRNSEPCRVVTKPFTVHHSKLYLNADTWTQGAIRVEVLTRDWQPIPGFTEPEATSIQGDALDHPVRWKERADVSQFMGKEIRLKFYLSHARIHAMTLCNEDRPLGAVSADYRSEILSDSAPKLN